MAWAKPDKIPITIKYQQLLLKVLVLPLHPLEFIRIVLVFLPQGRTTHLTPFHLLLRMRQIHQKRLIQNIEPEVRSPQMLVELHLVIPIVPKAVIKHNGVLVKRKNEVRLLKVHREAAHARHSARHAKPLRQRVHLWRKQQPSRSTWVRNHRFLQMQRPLRRHPASSFFVWGCIAMPLKRIRRGKKRWGLTE